MQRIQGISPVAKAAKAASETANTAARNLREEASLIRASAESAMQSGDDRVLALAEAAVFHASRTADRCRSNPDFAAAHLALAEAASTAMVAASQPEQAASLTPSYTVFSPGGFKMVTIHSELILRDVLGLRPEGIARVRLQAGDRDGCTLHGNGRMILGCDFVTVRLA